MAAFGWHVIELNGHDPEAIAQAFDEAERADKPATLVARTVKGWGVESMLGKNFHGKTLSDPWNPGNDRLVLSIGGRVPS